MIKAIFFDIDGTLVKNDSRALESTRRAILTAQENGVLCGVATGRGPVDLHKRIDNLELDMFVTYNGQLVYTAEREVYSQPFSKEVLAEIVTFANEHSRQVMFGSRTKMDGSTLMQWSQSRTIKRIVSFFPPKPPVRAARQFLQRYSPHRRPERYSDLPILDEPIYQCVMFSAESELPQLKKALPDCSFQRSNPYSVDIIPKGGSKLHGIKEFSCYAGISLDEVMAFGDNLNDIQMLKGVGVGVAMANGTSCAKKSADYITDRNDKDGIYKALKHFQVI